jgi:hypothetical protein
VPGFGICSEFDAESRSWIWFLDIQNDIVTPLAPHPAVFLPHLLRLHRACASAAPRRVASLRCSAAVPRWRSVPFRAAARHCEYRRPTAPPGRPGGKCGRMGRVAIGHRTCGRMGQGEAGEGRLQGERAWANGAGAVGHWSGRRERQAACGNAPAFPRIPSSPWGGVGRVPPHPPSRAIPGEPQEASHPQRGLLLLRPGLWGR